MPHVPVAAGEPAHAAVLVATLASDRAVLAPTRRAMLPHLGATTRLAAVGDPPEASVESASVFARVQPTGDGGER